MSGTQEDLEERCRKQVKKILALQPYQDTRAFAERRILTREYVRPGIYQCPGGTKIQVYGPVRREHEYDPEKAYYVNFRILEGSEQGFDNVELLGPDSFFKRCYQRLDS